MEYEIKPIRRHFTKLGLMYFLGTLLIFGIQYAAAFLIIRLPFIRIYDTDAWLISTMLPMYLISMPLMMLLIRQVPAVPVEKHRMTFVQWLTAFFICYAVMYLSNLIGLGVTFVIGIVKGSPVDNALADIVTDINPWTALFFMVLCAPILEELIFRKLLIDRTVRYGEKTAILFSGIFFGLFHGNLNQFAYAFILGVFWGFIYVKTGKILYTICMHMVVNFLGSVASIFLMRAIDYEELMYASASGDTAALMNTGGTMAYNEKQKEYTMKYLEKLKEIRFRVKPEEYEQYEQAAKIAGYPSMRQFYLDALQEKTEKILN